MWCLDAARLVRSPCALGGRGGGPERHLSRGQGVYTRDHKDQKIRHSSGLLSKQKVPPDESVSQGCGNVPVLRVHLYVPVCCFTGDEGNSWERDAVPLTSSVVWDSCVCLNRASPSPKTMGRGGPGAVRPGAGPSTSLTLPYCHCRERTRPVLSLHPGSGTDVHECRRRLGTGRTESVGFRGEAARMHSESWRAWLLEGLRSPFAPS